MIPLTEARESYLAMLSDRKNAYESEKDRIIRENPSLSAIRSRIHGIFTDELRGIHTHGEAEALSDEAEKELLREAERLGVADSIAPYRPLCPVCSDTGYVSGRPCTCLTSHITKTCFGGGLPEKLSDFDPEIYSSEASRKLGHRALKTAMSYIENFGKRKENLALIGTAGSGKTLLSGIIAAELLKKGVSVVRLRAADLIDVLGDSLFGEDSGSEIIKGCGLLVIDDLGTERQTNFTQSVLYDLIDSRYLGKLPTIITANLSLEKQKDMYGDRFISRFYSMSTENIKMPDEDIRLRKRTS